MKTGRSAQKTLPGLGPEESVLILDMVDNGPATAITARVQATLDGLVAKGLACEMHSASKLVRRFDLTPAGRALAK